MNSNEDEMLNSIRILLKKKKEKKISVERLISLKRSACIQDLGKLDRMSYFRRVHIFRKILFETRIRILSTNLVFVVVDHQDQKGVTKRDHERRNKARRRQKSSHDRDSSTLRRVDKLLLEESFQLLPSSSL